MHNTCWTLATYEMPNILTVTGIFCGTVQDLSLPLPSKPTEFWSMINDFEKKYCRSGFGDPQKSLASLMTVLSRGRLKDRWPDFVDDYPDLALLQDWYNTSQSDRLIEGFKPHEPFGKCLLHTKEGSLGMGSQSAQIGTDIHIDCCNQCWC